MPYIKQEDKDRLGSVNQAVFENPPRTPGELNWMLSVVVKNYLTSQGKKYQTINDIVGALEGAKLEFYRRVAAPYEDGKIKENGDVY